MVRNSLSSQAPLRAVSEPLNNTENDEPRSENMASEPRSEGIHCPNYQNL